MSHSSISVYGHKSSWHRTSIRSAGMWGLVESSLCTPAVAKINRNQLVKGDDRSNAAVRGKSC